MRWGGGRRLRERKRERRSHSLHCGGDGGVGVGGGGGEGARHASDGGKRWCFLSFCHRELDGWPRLGTDGREGGRVDRKGNEKAVGHGKTDEGRDMGRKGTQKECKKIKVSRKKE